MLGAAGQTPRASPPPPLPPGALRGLCAWLDGLPLSRPKRHLARDFSDGVMLAEIVKHFYPRLVDLHNYVPTCNTDRKLSNWSTLNRKVFHKLRLWVSETDIRKVVANTPGAIEPILAQAPPAGLLTDRGQSSAPLGTLVVSVSLALENCGHVRGRSSHSGRAGASWLPTPRRLQLPKWEPSACPHRMQVPCGGVQGFTVGDIGPDGACVVPSVGSVPHPHPACWALLWGQRPQMSLCSPLRPTGPHGGLQCEDPSDSREDRLLCVHRWGPSGWTLGAPGLRAAAAAGGKGAGAGCPAGDGQEVCAFLKILQMKVVRLEHLVKLKDQRIGELTRLGDKAND